MSGLSEPLSIPPLEPKMPGLPLQALGLVRPGVRRVLRQIKPYTHYWSEQNAEALSAFSSSGQPLLIAVGDSTAIGIGASAPQHSYVGRLQQALSQRDGTTWGVVNLALSGARVEDGLQRQLPLVEQLAQAGASSLCVCCLGSNDVLWNRDAPGLRDDLAALITGLPSPSVVGLIAGGAPTSRAANHTIRQTANERGFPVVNPWRQPNSPRLPLSEDRFHPNDEGYAMMAGPFAAALDAPAPPVSVAR